LGARLWHVLCLVYGRQAEEKKHRKGGNHEKTRKEKNQGDDEGIRKKTGGVKNECKKRVSESVS